MGKNYGKWELKHPIWKENLEMNNLDNLLLSFDTKIKKL